VDFLRVPAHRFLLSQTEWQILRSRRQPPNGSAIPVFLSNQIWSRKLNASTYEHKF
jgi:hypothetical protein